MTSVPGGSPRVAIVQDYLTALAGGERVALAMADALPGARVVTSCYNPDRTFPEFQRHHIETTWLNKWWPFRRDTRLAFPLLARAFAGHRVDDVDVVVCSSAGWAHGVATSAPKIVYCHNPARWLYQPEDYFGRFAGVLGNLGGRAAAMRRRDREWAQRAALYLVNSTSVQERVRKHYGIEARLLPPPAGLLPDGPTEAVPGVEPGFLLSVARPRGYKHVAAVCQAVEQLPTERLVAVGGLPRHPDGRAWPERITGLKGISDAQLRWLYANADALLATSYEDFGLTPVEAFGFGTPVIALRAGGYLDSCAEGLTGVWVQDHSAEAVADAVRRFRSERFDRDAIRRHGARWSPERFAGQLTAIVDEVAEANARKPGR